MTNTAKEAYIKLVEEISLNAWPSHKIELYDGWLIRFSHNYTHRTNSVTQVGTSLLPIEEKSITARLCMQLPYAVHL